jgi:hypothetical protein
MPLCYLTKPDKNEEFPSAGSTGRGSERISVPTPIEEETLKLSNFASPRSLIYGFRRVIPTDQFIFVHFQLCVNNYFLISPLDKSSHKAHVPILIDRISDATSQLTSVVAIILAVIPRLQEHQN